MKVLHVTGENAATGRKGENGSYGDMTPPRSLGRYAPAVRLRRALPAHKRQDKEMALKSGKAGKRMRRCRFSIGSAPLTSITKSDAQISGGETRCGLKIPGVSPWWLPRAPPHSCLSVYRCHSAVMAAVSHSTPDTQFREGSSLQDGLYARTPRSVRPLRLIR